MAAIGRSLVITNALRHVLHELVLERDSRYAADAYHFLQKALAETVKELQGKELEGDRHVSGGELLEGFRCCALRNFGPMAMTVLEEWGVHRCEDVGEMVFNLISVGAFGKSERDRRADFADGYDFEAAFVRPFLPKSRRRALSETARADDR